jgi:hypothetical protein
MARSGGRLFRAGPKHCGRDRNVAPRAAARAARRKNNEAPLLRRLFRETPARRPRSGFGEEALLSAPPGHAP